MEFEADGWVVAFGFVCAAVVLIVRAWRRPVNLNVEVTPGMTEEGPADGEEIH